MMKENDTCVFAHDESDQMVCWFEFESLWLRRI